MLNSHAASKENGWKGRGHDVHVESDKGHGRIEKRTTTITWDAAWLFSIYRQAGWTQMRCLVQIQRERTIGQETTTTIHHSIASVDTRKASVMAGLCRSHWGVENQLHWRLDVGFGEDNRRARVGHAAENLSRVDRIALNMLTMEPSKKSIRRKRLRAGWDQDYLLGIIRMGTE